jgi:ABC-type sugar transport system ATPase subunit
MTDIRIQNVHKHYGSVVAVEDLSLYCEPGKMLALLGPSGCGKTSTLKMIAGIESVTSGSIKFGDREVSRFAPGERNIAMVFEDYALYPHLSVFENIAFPLRLRHFDRNHIDRLVSDTLSLLHLDDVRDENVRQMSGGAQQRVAIGRALVREPDVTLFDEPLSHLDADQKVKLRGEIKRLQQTQNLTSILVTHDQTEAFAMSDTIAVMNLGVLQQVGAPQELYKQPANTFVATFIGEPPMNLLPARITQNSDLVGVAGDGWTLRFSAALAGKVRGINESEVIVGIRPEHMRLETAKRTKAGHAEVKGEVFFREHRGDTDVLLVDPASGAGLPAERVYADVPGPTDIRQGDSVRLAFGPERISLFHADTGRDLIN